MTRRGTVLAAAATLMALVGVPPGDVASAAREAATCLGLPAVLVDAGTEKVVGTDLADVYVIVSAGPVDLRGGDDVVCVVGEADMLLAGPGNDLVDTTATRATFYVDLGEGDDVFDGGHGSDTVNATMGRDRVATGPGNDGVSVGTPSVPMESVVRLGPGDDSLDWEGNSVGPNGLASGGAGQDELAGVARWDFPAGAEVLVDTAAGSMSVDGATFARWRDLEVFSLASTTSTRVVFRGSPADERLDLGEGISRADVDLAGGDDAVASLESVPGSYDGGSGVDLLLPPLDQERLALDLSRLMSTTDEGVTTKARVGGFEEVTAFAGRATILGSRRADRIEIWGTRVEARGLAGADRIRLVATNWRGISPSRRARGDGGDDVLVGSRGDDVLIGGGGRDEARGGWGEDRCDAEVELPGCES